MGKAIRKPRPAMPNWYWERVNECWLCKNPNNCNQCKANRIYMKQYAEKKIKGKTVDSKKTTRRLSELDC